MSQYQAQVLLYRVPQVQSLGTIYSYDHQVGEKYFAIIIKEYDYHTNKTYCLALHVTYLVKSIFELRSFQLVLRSSQGLLGGACQSLGLLIVIKRQTSAFCCSILVSTLKCLRLCFPPWQCLPVSVFWASATVVIPCCNSLPRMVRGNVTSGSHRYMRPLVMMASATPSKIM